MFNELHHWLILSSDLEAALSYINDKAFSLSTDFLVAESTVNSRRKLYDVYNLLKSRGTNLIYEFFGDWNAKTGLNVTMSSEKYKRRSNLNGFTFRASFFKVRTKIFAST